MSSVLSLLFMYAYSASPDATSRAIHAVLCKYGYVPMYA